MTTVWEALSPEVNEEEEDESEDNEADDAGSEDDEEVEELEEEEIEEIEEEEDIEETEEDASLPPGPVPGSCMRVNRTAATAAMPMMTMVPVRRARWLDVIRKRGKGQSLLTRGL